MNLLLKIDRTTLVDIGLNKVLGQRGNRATASKRRREFIVRELDAYLSGVQISLVDSIEIQFKDNTP